MDLLVGHRVCGRASDTLDRDVGPLRRRTRTVAAQGSVHDDDQRPLGGRLAATKAAARMTALMRCRRKEVAMMTPVASAPTTDRVGEGVLVLAAGLLACATIIVPPSSELSARTLMTGAALAVLVPVAVLRRSAPALRAALVVSTMFVIFTVGAWVGAGPAVTTVAVGALPLFVLVLLQRRSAWWPALPWLRIGRLDPLTWGLATATILGAGAGLTAFAVVVRPEVSSYLLSLRSLPWWMAVVGVVGFAVVNPVWEELLYRGVLQTELAATVGAWLAVVVQALLFGLSHLHGFPSGWLGVAMAAGWGFALGVIRMRTDGLVIPYMAHVFANLAIGALAVVLLR